MADYVGKLTGIRYAGSGVETDVEPAYIGIDEHFGLVTARTRSDLAAGNYTQRPNGKKRRISELYYTRSRKDNPGGDQWFHELTYAFAISQGGKQDKPRVYLEGYDVHICPGMPGNYLCG